ncbi:MAG: DNA polymerase III subunit delta' [Burkholderiales bacterium]
MAPLAAGLPPWLAAQLKSLLGQRGHAWLLQGPSGLGQYTLALELARAWLCDAPSADGACGQCTSCHSIDVRTHADLCVLMPEALMLDLAWPLDEKTQKELDEKKRKPSREIKVEAARDMVAFTQLTRSRGPTKAVLVYPAERMNPIAANALLKTLEEPPGDVKFVLATRAADQLLPTIRSRCQAHTMSWPDSQAATAWLGAQGIATADAPLLLRAAGGRPEDALEFARSGRDATRWPLIPSAVARGEAIVFKDWTPAQAVDALQKLCHDLMAAGVGAKPLFFEPADLPPPPGAVVLSRWAKALFETSRTVEHPFNAGLMLEALVSQAQIAINSKR